MTRLSKQLYWVHIIQLSAPKKEVVTVILREGKITFEGNEDMIHRLKQGIMLGPDQSVLPTEGMPFLEALGNGFRSPYLFATSIQTGESVLPYQVE